MSVNRPQKLYKAKLCFLLDLTGSMDPVIKAVRSFLLDLLDYCERHYPNINLEVGFVGYRDVDSGGRNRYEALAFTSDIQSFKTQFSAVCECTGGGDEAEDVLGGMEQVLSMDWDHQNTHVKVLVHCGDSPHHGLLFHDPAVGSTGDSYPELEASPRPYKDILADFADSHIDYNFAQIKCPARSKFTTSRMLTLFAEAYNSFPSRRCDFAAEAMDNFTAKDLFAKVKSSLSSSIQSFMRSVSSRGSVCTTAKVSSVAVPSKTVSAAPDALDALLKHLKGAGSSGKDSIPASVHCPTTISIPLAIPVLSASSVSIGGLSRTPIQAAAANALSTLKEVYEVKTSSSNGISITGLMTRQ